MTRKIPFGKPMRDIHFQFSPSYTPLNHGSFGAYPRLIHEAQDAFTTLAQERPDTFIVYDLPKYIDTSRHAIAPLLGVPVEEVVFIPNATTGINTVLRNLKFEEGDVVVHFSTIYDACEKTLASVSEMTPVKCEQVLLDYPIEDEEILSRFTSRVQKCQTEGKRVRVAMFDTVLTFPGARMPWEDLVAACKKLGVLSLIDGAHGIGHIDLTHLGKVGPDFFVSNCHKWLYTPRACAVFHVPLHNQHLIHTSIPTSHGYILPSSHNFTSSLSSIPEAKSPFVLLFEFVATMDYTPYLCIPAALSFRNSVCGGEEAIRQYCFDLAKIGGDRVAKILGTSVMDTKSRTMTKCCFSTVLLPIEFGIEVEEEVKGVISEQDAGKVQAWMQKTAVGEFDTYLQIGFYGGRMWVRLSGQVYLGMESFEWVGWRLKELCARVREGEATS